VRGERRGPGAENRKRAGAGRRVPAAGKNQTDKYKLNKKQNILIPYKKSTFSPRAASKSGSRVFRKLVSGTFVSVECARKALK
jgi:hypothetical protein